MKKKLKCVLLIDDDDASNFINKIVIKKLNITDHIEIALNGQMAVDFLTNTGNHAHKGTDYPKPELILLDINMPIMDGWEFLKVYENIDIYKKGNIVIVMLTTSFNPDDETKASKINSISGFKHKPLTTEMLEEIMQTHF